MRLSRFVFLPVLTSTLATACTPRAPFTLGTPVSRDCSPALETRYFPPGTITGWPPDFDGDLFLRRGYARSLSLMQEPSLYCGSSDEEEAYRFLWLRTWHNPVAIRIFRRGDRRFLEAVVLSGSGGFEPGQISMRVTRNLSRTQWRRFVAALDQARFWQTTTTIDDTLGNDGAQWIIEGRREGRYHFVDRWGGSDRVRAVRPLGEMLIEFSDLQVGSVY